MQQLQALVHAAHAAPLAAGEHDAGHTVHGRILSASLNLPLLKVPLAASVPKQARGQKPRAPLRTCWSRIPALGS
jgi:hypothetical protein